jgi:FkbM family methyltransferase
MLNRIKRKIRSIKNKLINGKYKIDGFELALGKGHMLPIYQEIFCYYDRVLPFLAEATNVRGSEGWVIDIGANVGDTTAAMVNHTGANFLCVEPDEVYFGLLKNNVAKWGLEHRISLENSYIAMDTSKCLGTKRSSGSAVLIEKSATPGAVQGKTLRELIIRKNIALDSIELVKVDTDGYDWQCILSLGDVLDKYTIPLYWENYIVNSALREGYHRLVDRLSEAGYSHFFIFDNYGNFLHEGSCDLLRGINDYLLRVRACKTGITFYYVDVIAVKDNMRDNIRHAVDDYIKSTSCC